MVSFSGQGCPHVLVLYAQEGASGHLGLMASSSCDLTFCLAFAPPSSQSCRVGVTRQKLLSTLIHARQEDGHSREEQELERRGNPGLPSLSASSKANCLPEVPFHFIFSCHSSIVQGHGQGWSWLHWQRKPAVEDEGEP